MGGEGIKEGGGDRKKYFGVGEGRLNVAFKEKILAAGKETEKEERRD